MDTRKKMVPVEDVPALLSAGEWAVVVGLFDPMTAAQARRIARQGEEGRKLLAVVLDDAESLLPASGRAALVAALRTVDAVTVARPGEWKSAVAADTAGRIVDEDIDAERARTANFVRFVIDRATSSAGAER